MGYYTQFHFNATLKSNIEDDKKLIRQLIDCMKDDRSDIPSVLPKHDFFKQAWWRAVLYGACIKTAFCEDCIFVDCNIKNYDDQIEKFLDWISDYVILPVIKTGLRLEAMRVFGYCQGECKTMPYPIMVDNKGRLFVNYDVEDDG